MRRSPRTSVRPRTSLSTISSPRTAESSYTAYVSQQNLLVDDSDEPIDHPAISGLFDTIAKGRYRLKREHRH